MKKIILLLLLSATIFSCSIVQKAQAPRYDLIADSLSSATVNQVHNMYERMKTSDANYPLWVSSYDSSINNLDLLISNDSARKNNAAILKITWDWKNRLETYKKEHENYKVINKTQILIYQDWMDNLGNKIYLTEKNYK